MNGMELILAERQRQQLVEGWTPAHDDLHDRRELYFAATCYERAADWCPKFPLSPWPWAKKWWKPSSTPVRNLVKAGALYLAEADRMFRLGCNRREIWRTLRNDSKRCGLEIDRLQRLKAKSQNHISATPVA
jgi:hypothetical protein